MITAFEREYKKLNTEQKQAVDNIEGPVMVIAGPGTGKTQVLILRIANILLRSQVEPENILALTFTEAAKYEMRQRLVTIIGTAGYRVEINTFHGFCNDIIQHHAEEFEELVDFESIEQIEQIQIIEQILEKNKFECIKPFSSPYHYVKPLVQAIDELKKEGIDPGLFARGLKTYEKSLTVQDNKETIQSEKKHIAGELIQKQICRNKELLKVYREYQKMLFDQKKYDFNDMLLAVIRSFETNPAVLQQIRELYQYILIDEHQDTNAAQNKITELICRTDENPNLFVVGDEKQAIFRFQGATLENFLFFKNLYKNALLINLSINYRSTQKILDAAQSVIIHNPRTQALPFAQDLQSAHTASDTRIGIIETEYSQEEYYVLAKIVAGLHGKKNDVHPSTAVLVRNNKDSDMIVDMFKRMRIPHVVEAEKSIFENLYIQKFLSICRALIDFGSERTIIEVMHIDSFCINPIDIYRLIRFASGKKLFLYDVIERIDEFKADLHLKEQNKITAFISHMKSWKEKSMNDSFDNIFISIINESGLLKAILREENRFQILEDMTLLFDKVKQQVAKNHLFRIEHFMAYVDLLKKHNISIHKDTRVRETDRVRIMTVHRAKGREFDYVFIPQTHDSHWGNKRRRSSPFHIPWAHLTVKYDTQLGNTENEDERRLFYVALTRAKKQVYISYAKHNDEDGEQVISQFVEEIADGHKQLIPIDKYRKELTSHPEKALVQIPVSNSEIKRIFFENRSFFQDLFIHKGLSVSGLNNFLDCPWKYFFRNLLQIPDVKNKNLIFGSAIHSAVNAYIVHRKKANVQLVQKYFKEALSKSPVNEQEYGELNEKGEEVIHSYYPYMKEWPMGVLPEVQIRGVRLTEHIYLNGRIDMIMPLDNKGAIEVYDFKTGKPKTRAFIEGKTKDSSGDYFRQLVFYKLLLEKYKEGRTKWSVERGVIDFVELDNKKLHHKEVFNISQHDVADLEKAVLETGEAIRSISFWNKGCKKKDCEYCRMRSYME